MARDGEDDVNELLTMSDAARQLGVERTAVYRIFPAGERVRRFGRWLVRRQDVDKYERDPKHPGRPRKEQETQEG